MLALLNQLGGLEPTSPVTRWSEPVPAALLDLVRRMDRERLSLLRLVRHGPAALDLRGGGENLLWLAAVVAAERKAPWEELAAILQRKRRYVVEWCGGDGSKAAVKAVKEYRVARFTSAELRTLRERAARPKEPDRIREQYESRNRELLEYPFYVAATRKLAGKRLRDSAETRDVLQLHQDVCRLAATSKIDDIDAQLRALQRIGGLRRLHDELADRLLERNEPLPRDQRHPPPPLRGTKEIVPLRTAALLAHEGRVMQHCCEAYHHDARTGQAYLYRVLAPERATLELEPTGNRPRLVQLRGVRNAPVSPETKRAVFAWYDAALAEWRQRQEQRRRKRQGPK
ncbi:MAG: PcfJ domain-containing protein [Sorangiineae bacterium]|nr:PcfJ domain-containing protein [Polyangiaceae bacterium]MEB2322841.1 PcfJ domain-containing protein [Sorangiineae bacterium]